ncbi:MAG TPA: hypothetical protein VKG24_05640, partial [Pseudolabrys sp.]|nr:hypothetical protein [Pseudolabrys sp.]
SAGSSENRKQRGISGYNLGQNPDGRAYLIVSALVAIKPSRISAFDSAFTWNACHSCPNRYRMMFVNSIRGIFFVHRKNIRTSFGQTKKNADRYRTYSGTLYRQ